MVAVSCLVHYDMLLQSTTDINNAGTILLQNATKVYFKMRQVFYYKMQQFCQIAIVIAKCVNFIIKSVVHYKMHGYKRIGSDG